MLAALCSSAKTAFCHDRMAAVQLNKLWCLLQLQYVTPNSGLQGEVCVAVWRAVAAAGS